MCEWTEARWSQVMTRKFFFFSEMGYNAYPLEALEQYGYSALLFPNSIFDAEKARDLWQMFLREHEYASEMDFDGSVCNEHHNNVLSMQESVNISAAVISQRIKGTIALIGNPLPIHDNPVRVAEEIAMLDLISGGRIISGFVRGTGIEQLSTNANPAYNRERFEEAFALIKKAWTVPGPFRWESKHYHLRVVNPWQLPLQKPHPPIWAAGILSPETIRWAAKQRITYLVLGSALDATAQCREIYHEVAQDDGWSPTPEHLGYLIHTCVMDTDEDAYEMGRHHYGGASVIGRSGGVAASALSEDRQQHRPLAADIIGDDAADHATGGPAEHGEGENIAGILRNGRSLANIKQLLQGEADSQEQGVDLAAEVRGDKDPPLLARYQ